MLQFGAKHFIGSIPKWPNSRTASAFSVRQSCHSWTRSRWKRVFYFFFPSHTSNPLWSLSFRFAMISRYFFSWRDPALKGVEEDWLGARNYCRQRCMDSVSLETSNENEWIKARMVNEKVIFFPSASHFDNLLLRFAFASPFKWIFFHLFIRSFVRSFVHWFT